MGMGRFDPETRLKTYFLDKSFKKARKITAVLVEKRAFCTRI
jgi:hypothetical protein